MARTKASSRSFVAMVAVIALLGLVLIGSPSAWVSGSGKSQGTPEDETRLSTFRTATMKGAELPSSHSSLLHEESDQISGAALTAAMVAAVLGFLVAVPGAMATIGGPGWEVRNVMPVEAPVPDENPFIRQLQAKSWQMEPVLRQRNFLKAMKNRLFQKGELGFFQPKYFVHWGEDSFKYDILEQKNYNEAQKLGRIRVDADMTEPNEELPVFVYTKPTDQNWVAENLGVFDLVEIPDELQVAIQEIRSIPFPGYGGSKVNVPAPVSTMPPKEMLVSATPAKEMMVPATPPSDTVSSSPPKDMFEVAGSEVGQVAGMSPAQMAERRAAWQRLEPAEVNYIREDEME